MNKYIYVTIGPVQGFISQSKKTKDFFNRSNIVGEILKELISSIECKDSELILPSFLEEIKLYEIDISNYFIIQVNQEFDTECVRKKYEIIVNKIDSSLHNDLDMYIAISSKLSYKEAFKELVNRIRMYKTIKTFQKNNENNNTSNCTICGKYAEFQDGLCQSCSTIRKHGKESDNFPSTLYISALEFINSNKGIIDNYINKLIKEGIIKNRYEKYDGHIFYEDILIKEKGNRATEIYKEFFKDKAKPTKYYSLIKCDIDDLGKWIYGKYTRNNNLIDIQQNISEKIIEFGLNIKKYVEEQNIGKTVYAGGDDILTFISVAYIEKYIRFVEAELKKLNDYFIDRLIDKDIKFSLSRSITIAHNTIPLNEVIAIDNKNMEFVKSKYEDTYTRKNGTIVSFISTSTTYKTTYYQESEVSTINDLFNNANCLKKDITKSIVVDLDNLVRGLNIKKHDSDTCSALEEILLTQYKRILNRKIIGENDSNKIENLYDSFKKIVISNCDCRKSQVVDYENIISYLYITASIAREINREELT